MFGKLLSELSNAVSFLYKNDATSPGITISTLKNKKCYASIVRYGSGDGFKNGKQVVFKCVANSQLEAVKQLATELIASEEPTPVDVLRNTLISIYKTKSE
jgi:hypothetical protein